MSASASFSHLTARTEAGRNEILELVKAAKKSGLLHVRRPKKETQPPKHKLQNAAKVFSQTC